MTTYFGEITVRKVRETLKTFKAFGAQNLVHLSVSDTVLAGIQKLKECNVGHLIVTENNNVSTTVGVVSKKDMLVFMIKNFTTDSKIDVLLDEKIGNLDIGTQGNKVVYAGKHETLRKILQEINRLKVSCIPIVDDQLLYLGAITKGHIEVLLRECCLEYVAGQLTKARNEGHRLHRLRVYFA